VTKRAELAIGAVKHALALGMRVQYGARGLARGPVIALVRAATTMARTMSALDMPPATGTQRIVLTGLASQLRMMASSILPSTTDQNGDPEDVSRALGELVQSTLGLVDAALATPPELKGGDGIVVAHAKSLNAKDDAAK
jgi:hypothetical protein